MVNIWGETARKEHAKLSCGSSCSANTPIVPLPGSSGAVERVQSDEDDKAPLDLRLDCEGRRQGSFEEIVQKDGGVRLEQGRAGSYDPEQDQEWLEAQEDWNLWVYGREVLSFLMFLISCIVDDTMHHSANIFKKSGIKVGPTAQSNKFNYSGVSLRSIETNPFQGQSFKKDSIQE